ncbi:MAG: hypothetical protein KDD69_07710 [Bdellovibrionales bacterium]|nr:hypothetical protein [Bdellovibrionales bacterium]
MKTACATAPDREFHYRDYLENYYMTLLNEARRKGTYGTPNKQLDSILSLPSPLKEEAFVAYCISGR